MQGCRVIRGVGGQGEWRAIHPAQGAGQFRKFFPKEVVPITSFREWVKIFLEKGPEGRRPFFAQNVTWDSREVK